MTPSLSPELNRIAKLFDTSRPQVVIVVGAGVAINATDKRYASWFGLLKHGIKHLVENLSGVGTKPGEECWLLLFHTVRSLAARQDRSVEGEMTQQIERVGVRLACLHGNCLEVDPTLGKLTNNLGALIRIDPADAQFVGI